MGQIDLVIEAGLEAYDIAAPAALIRAAGGVVTDWEGGDPRWGGRVVAAGDPRVHEAALACLARA
jgi:myo-inositol-1(or 4)-monophosphatase